MSTLLASVTSYLRQRPDASHARHRSRGREARQVASSPSPMIHSRESRTNRIPPSRSPAKSRRNVPGNRTRLTHRCTPILPGPTQKNLRGKGAAVVLLAGSPGGAFG